MISGLRERAIAASPPSRFCTAAVAMIVRGQSELTAMPSSFSSSASPSVLHAHPVLGDRVGEVAARPARVAG